MTAPPAETPLPADEPPSEAERRALAGWQHTGRVRPAFAWPTGPGQESVWDYPRPPRLAPERREVVVRLGPVEIARSRRALRVLETASPPTVYLPPQDVQAGRLVRAAGASHCEWKGLASYWSVVADGRRLEAVGWSYDRPTPRFEAIRGWLSFYPASLDITLDGVRVLPQPGGYYGGWVTPEIVGPFKGEPGTGGW